MEGLQNLAEPVVRRWLIVGAILLAICLGMILALMVRPATAAQLSCGPLELLLKQLAERYHEFPVMTATNQDGAKVQVTLSDAGTFTVLLGDGKGACVILAGDKAEFDNGI
ncbi:hypothetical protein NKJ71_19315 [Mesorhizobium sp. M0050]|uniref:hypothetical protein n=1 Tax=Mesorhizobium sp. M0050 TaxID=2956861 RepID=UPI00333B9F84